MSRTKSENEARVMMRNSGLPYTSIPVKLSAAQAKIVEQMGKGLQLVVYHSPACGAVRYDIDFAYLTNSNHTIRVKVSMKTVQALKLRAVIVRVKEEIAGTTEHQGQKVTNTRIIYGL